MISVDGNTYTMMYRNKTIIYFPNPRKVRVNVVSNLIYMVGAHTLGNSSEEEGDLDSSYSDAGNSV